MDDYGQLLLPWGEGKPTLRHARQDAALPSEVTFTGSDFDKVAAVGKALRETAGV